MKVKMKIEKEYDVKYLYADVDVRYWEDAKLNGKDCLESGDGFPCKDGDSWKPEINIETGEIENWISGNTASIHFKVCDAGIYKLIDEKGICILTKNSYVPDCMCPNGGGYGDYVIMDIKENGFIQDWRSNIDDFCGDDD